MWPLGVQLLPGRAKPARAAGRPPVAQAQQWRRAAAVAPRGCGVQARQRVAADGCDRRAEPWQVAGADANDPWQHQRRSQWPRRRRAARCRPTGPTTPMRMEGALSAAPMGHSPGALPATLHPAWTAPCTPARAAGRGGGQLPGRGRPSLGPEHARQRAGPGARGFQRGCARGRHRMGVFSASHWVWSGTRGPRGGVAALIKG